MTAEGVGDDHSVQAAVRNLFLDSAPEREADLAAMWQELQPKFQIAPDLHEGNRLIMDAGAYRYVRFNHRVLRAFWIAAFAAWEGYRAVAEATSLEVVDLTRFKELLAAFETTIVGDDPHLEPLPLGIPEPGDYPDKHVDPQGRAAAELATIAAAWALLHELRHIRHQREGTGADPLGDNTAAKHQEEISCDEFGTTFLLEGTEVYAQQAKVSVGLVRQKHQLGIYFGLFALAMLTKDNWRASESHPSAQTRINAVRDLMTAQRSDMAAAIAHVAFAVLASVWPGTPTLY
jgi:hypothetical protein